MNKKAKEKTLRHEEKNNINTLIRFKNMFETDLKTR